jgi:long-chain acyl-CoA synthetase
MHSDDATTVALIARLASALPERVALSDEHGTQLRFGALWDQIRGLAGVLRERGIRKGDRVVIHAPNSIAWSLWEYAAQAAAAVPVGVGMQWTSDHVRTVLADCDARALVIQNEELLSKLGPTDRQALVCVLEADSGNGRGTTSWVSHAELVAGGNAISDLPKLSADDPATIVYTSGSTGTPKGIMHTHRGVMAAVDAIVDLFPELVGGRLALSWMPMEHLFQRILNLVSFAFHMETRVLLDPSKLISSARDLRPTYLAGVPLVYERLLAAIDSDPDSFADWRRELRLMIVGSAPISRKLLERFWARGYPILQAYSTSECIVPIAANTLSANRIGSVGRPLPSYDLRILDDGEIEVRGPGVFCGYYGLETEVDSVVDAEGYFKTGDIGDVDRDGYLFITGRSDDFFKTSTGRRVSPFEVESAYQQCELIEKVVVFGRAQKHVVGLVQLAARGAEVLARRLGLDATNPFAWSQDERMAEAVLQEMRKHEGTLDVYKRVRAVALLPHPFRVETGELTPTLKVRRDVVEQRYQSVLAALFEGKAARADGGHAAS